MTTTTSTAKVLLKSAKRKSKRELPLDPERENDRRAATARKVLAYFRKICPTDRQEVIGDLISNVMHRCDRDPRYGPFEVKLDRGLQHYYEETLPDHLYATGGRWQSPLPTGSEWKQHFWAHRRVK